MFRRLGEGGGSGLRAERGAHNPSPYTDITNLCIPFRKLLFPSSGERRATTTCPVIVVSSF
jgi:hypothetical protein